MSIPNELQEVQDEFLNGVLEVYENLMSAEVRYYMMNEQNTKVNIYQEAPVKSYMKPIDLWAKVVVNRSPDGEVDVDKGMTSATITVPTKDLINKGIDHSVSNYDTLEKGIFEFKGAFYQIEKVTPMTAVANEFLFFKFICTEIKKDSLMTVVESGDENASS